MDVQTEMVFRMSAFFRPILHCVLRKFRYQQKCRVFPSETFFQLRTSPRHINRRTWLRAINLAGESGRSARDKLDRRRSTKLIIHSSSDARPQFITGDRQPPSTARFCRLATATADTCQSIQCAVIDLLSVWSNKAGVKRELLRHRQSKEARILWSHHEETRELLGERDNARNNARCTKARKATHGLDGHHQDVDRTLRGRVNQNDRGQG